MAPTSHPARADTNSQLGLGNITTLADVEDFLATLSANERSQLEDHLIPELVQLHLHGSTSSGLKDDITPERGALLFSVTDGKTPPPDSGEPTVSFKVKYGPHSKYVSFPKSRNYRLSHLSNTIFQWLDVPVENQRLICAGRLVKVAQRLQDGADPHLGELDGQVVIILGSMFNISKAWKDASRTDRSLQAVYSRRLHFTRIAADEALVLHAAAARHRHAHSRPDAWQRHAAGSNDTEARLFGVHIGLPCQSSAELAAALVGVGVIPRFRCRHRNYDDYVDGLGCKPCTQEWLARVYVFLVAWLQHSVQHYQIALENHQHSSQPPPRAHGAAASAKSRRNELADESRAAQERFTAMSNDWRVPRPDFEVQVQELTRFLDLLNFNPCFEDPELIKCPEVDAIQQDVFALEMARKCMQVQVKQNEKGIDLGLVSHARGWTFFLIEVSKQL